MDATHDTSLPWPDAALALACRDVTRIIHVDTDGGFGLDASSTITGDVGTWTSLFSQDLFFEVRADSDASWAVAGASDWQNGQWLDAGTYTSSGDDHFGWWIQVEADNHACGKIPTGTFTIYDISALDEQTLSKLLVTFDLACAGQGSLAGCARFER